MSGVARAHFFILLANLIYGANYVIAKEVMPDYLLPFGFILIRVVCATLMFQVIHFLFIREKVAKWDLLRLFWCGVFGMALNQLMFFKGLNLTTPINASLIMITAPIAVILFSYFAKVERLSIPKILGIILGAFGAFLIIFHDKEVSVSTNTFLGDLFILINACSYAIYLVLVKPLMIKYHPITIVKWAFTFGMLFVIPAGIEEFLQADWGKIPWSIWLCIVYVVVGTTFFAYLLNIFALRKVDPSVVGIYIYLQPIIASVISLALAKDHLTFMKVVASILIFSGIYLVSRKSLPKRV